MFQGTKKLRTSNASLSPLSPTTLLSRHLTINYYQNSSDDITYNPTTLIEASKIQQLPDLVKESSILKSKTTSNIYDESLIKDRKLIKDQMFVHRANKNIKNNIENLENSQNMENILLNNVEEHNEFRPRSPLHETSIVVPQVNWSKKNEEKDNSSDDLEIDSDSLSSDFNETVENDKFIANLSPPRLQIHSTDGDLVLDEEIERYKYDPDDSQAFEPDSIEVSCLQDQKLLNRCALDVVSSTDDRHAFEIINNNMDRLNLQDNIEKNNCDSPVSETSIISNKQDNSEENDITTAFTETEFSEWARDGEALVSDDLYDVELDPSFIRKKNTEFSAKMSTVSIHIPKKNKTEFHCCKNDQKFSENNHTLTLWTNDEDINYMDTDNELLLDDSLQDVSHLTVLRNRGYIEFINIKADNVAIPNTQCNLAVTKAPIVKLDLENDSYKENEEEGFKDANVIEIDPITMEDMIDKLNKSVKRPLMAKSEIHLKLEEQYKEISNRNTEHKETKEQLIEAYNKEFFYSIEEDSLLTMEPTEDITTSEAITILASPSNHQLSILSTKMTEQQNETNKTNCNNPDHSEYLNRLHSKITEFNNTKAFDDAKKPKRKISKNIAQIRSTDITKDIAYQKLTINDNNVSSPATSKKLEEITRERSKQKDLIQDLLMDKFKVHKQKSAEKKARRAARTSSLIRVSSSDKLISPNIPSAGTKFVPISVSLNSSSTFTTNETKTLSDFAISSHSPEKSEHLQLQKEMTKKTNDSKQSIDEKSSSTSLENIFRMSFASLGFKNKEEQVTKQNKEDIKNWIIIKSNENLSLSPKNKFKEQKLNIIQRQFSLEDTKQNSSKNEKIRPHSFNMMDDFKLKLQINESTDNIKHFTKRFKCEELPTSTKSMDELLSTADISDLDESTLTKKDKKKPKDLKRKKSFIQAVSEFFLKKETTSLFHHKDKISMSRLTSKSKEKVSIFFTINIKLLFTIIRSLSHIL